MLFAEYTDITCRVHWWPEKSSDGLSQYFKILKEYLCEGSLSGFYIFLPIWFIYRNTVLFFFKSLQLQT